ncbi:MAG: CRISPR-associated protein, Csd2 family [Marinobacter excellens HL-55]|uniref:CRISPR-associated protein, Csd2 family n=1 Tax=Marinobacter excellens HL-55 TaxID=1305731 RepID=A0A0P7YE62_9GAMM|nr:MAG: CRISPR-associated protein, Csd2 family [Marinobacter excellens HL-55]
MSLDNRYEFVFLFDVKDGNPNGDPDAGNLPRVDAETGQGLVTDVCLKRKIRNYVGMVKSEEPPFDIYVKEKAVLNRNHEKAYKALDLKPESKKLPKKEEDAKKVTGWMCGNFFDIRTFGAVMSTEINAGQVRGPVQINFSRSVEPVVSAEHSITRMAVATEKEAEKQSGDNRTMGRKFTIPYGLYRCHGFISANLAKQTGFGEEDLELFWDALVNMLDHDRSASRGEMSPCALYVFKHDSVLGNAPARKLFELIDVNRISEGPARDFGDYKVSVQENLLPAGVQLIKYLD